MTHLLLVYLHLIATCAAIGVILATDVRLAADLWHRARHAEARRTPLRLAPPSPFVVRMVGAALAVLLVTGVALVALALQARPDALANPKLQAKIAFVALLVLNSVALHRLTFPGLARRARPRAGAATPPQAFGERLRDAALLCAPVGASHGLWAYCAFLGIARPWNFSLPLEAVMAVGAAFVAVAWLGCTALVAAASAPPTARVTAIPNLDVAPDAQPAGRRA